MRLSKAHNFTANRAAMMKSRKTGRPIPLYIVDVLPRAKFEEIYNIKEICYIRLAIERFKGANIIKQCYRCQTFCHASEICLLSPKCAKCASPHLTPECPQMLELLCLDAAEHRGCPKTPQIHRIRPISETIRREKPKAFSNIMAEIIN